MLQKNCYGTFHWPLILSLFHEILQLHFVMTLFKRKKMSVFNFNIMLQSIATEHFTGH